MCAPLCSSWDFSHRSECVCVKVQHLEPVYAVYTSQLLPRSCTNYFSLCALCRSSCQSWHFSGRRLPRRLTAYRQSLIFSRIHSSVGPLCRAQKKKLPKAEGGKAACTHCCCCSAGNARRELRPSYCYYRGVPACSAKLLCALQGCMCPDGTSVPCMHCTAHRASVTISSPPRKDFLKTVACTFCYWLQLDLRC